MINTWSDTCLYNILMKFNQSYIFGNSYVQFVCDATLIRRPILAIRRLSHCKRWSINHSSIIEWNGESSTTIITFSTISDHRLILSLAPILLCPSIWNTRAVNNPVNREKMCIAREYTYDGNRLIIKSFSCQCRCRNEKMYIIANRCLGAMSLTYISWHDRDRVVNCVDLCVHYEQSTARNEYASYISQIAT